MSGENRKLFSVDLMSIFRRKLFASMLPALNWTLLTMPLKLMKNMTKT